MLAQEALDVGESKLLCWNGRQSLHPFDNLKPLSHQHLRERFLRRNYKAIAARCQREVL